MSRNPYLNSPQDTYEKRLGQLSKLFNGLFNKNNFDMLHQKGLLPQNAVQTLKVLWEAMEEVYPERGDIHFELCPKMRLHRNIYGSNHARDIVVYEKTIIKDLAFYIKFPEITISNTNNLTHTIRDLYVGLKMSVEEDTPSGIIFNEIMGFRETVTSAEYVKGYSHSHLQTADFSTVDERFHALRFCTGHGDIVASKSLLNSDFSDEAVRLFLLQLQPLVEWESLEGVPYNYMENVLSAGSSPPNINEPQIQSSFSRVKNYINSYGFPSKVNNISWEFVNGSYRIIENEDLEDFVTDLADRASVDGSNFVFKTLVGEYVKLNSVVNSPPRTFPEYIYFRGEKIFFKKINPDYGLDRTQGLKRTVVPKLTKYVKSKLEYSVNYSKLRENLFSQ